MRTCIAMTPRPTPRIWAICILLVFWTAAIPSLAAELDDRAVTVVPDQEKRSTIQDVDGYAYLSEDKTLSQTRQAAMTNAKRQAVEQAKTYISSKTTVENFEITQDIIEGASAGAVTVLEQKDLGIEDNNRYHVWIRAEVEYGLKPPSPSAPMSSAAAPITADGPLTVKVWTPKKHYQDGERIEIFIQGNRDFYARIVDITTSGDIFQLLPNAYRGQTQFMAGKVYRIPDTEDRFDLKVSPPYGEDQIVVYASDRPLGDVPLDPTGGGLGSYRGSREALGVRTRGIQVTGAAGAVTPDGPSGAEFYEGTWRVTTGP